MEFELGHLVEAFVIVLIILRQITVFGGLLSKIKRLKDLNLHDTRVIKISYPLSFLLEFNYENFRQLIKDALDKKEDKSIDQNSLVSSSLVYSSVKINDTQKIIKELNIYMLKNDQHTINFNIIRDIVDRNYQVLDDEINQSIPTPLYLGLAATMLGIIFGLWGMFPIDPNNIENQIGPLLTGVAIAMTSSVLGVILTSYLNTIAYRKAKKEAEEEKNLFFSQLQADLLPELIRKDDSAINKLNRNIESFSNIASNTIRELSLITKSSSQTIKLQSELMERVDNLNIRKISKLNLEVFEKLESNLNSLDSFSKYWHQLTNSLEAVKELNKNLNSLVNRLNGIEEIEKVINKTLIDYNSTMNYFTAHIEKIKMGGDLTLSTVSDVDKALESAIFQLRDNAKQRIQTLNESGAALDLSLDKIVNELSLNLEKVTDVHLVKVQEAYMDKTPDFGKLRQLDTLPQIYEAIDKNEKNLFKNEFLNEKLFSKIESIEKLLTDLSGSSKINESSQKKISAWSSFPGTLFKVITTIVLLIAGILFIADNLQRVLSDFRII